jgi:hypothetical protein
MGQRSWGDPICAPGTADLDPDADVYTYATCFTIPDGNTVI